MKSVMLCACHLVCILLLFSSCKKDPVAETDLSDGTRIQFADQATGKSRCATDKRMESLYQNRPGYRSEIVDGRLQEMLRLEKTTGRNAADLPLLTVPVHVIVVHQPGHTVGNRTNISEQRIISQIAVLNQDFLRLNSDADRTPAVFKASQGQIQFCLASRDPGGNPTNGISRFATNQDFDRNELQLKRATRWDPQRYLNIWVVPEIEGLGYAYLPTPNALPDPDEDGVVVITEAFGGPNSGAISPFDLGRTLTHEVGHYLGLDHIWGDGCRVDDGITDTPSQEQENYDCPSHPSPSCNNNGDMFMNYMDYVDDDCMNAFTTGQIAYMRNILSTSRSRLVTPGRTACQGDTMSGVPTCNDGIRNGNETGVDCGGSCPPCATIAGTDAGLSNLMYSIGAGECEPEVHFKVTLHNYGTSTLRSATIELRTGSNVLESFQWTGSLSARGRTNVNLPSISLNGGQYQVMARSLRPNGTTDANGSNDQTSTNLQVSGGRQLTLVIKPDDFGGDISWKVRDNQGQVLATGGNYPDFDRRLIRESFCLPTGCYQLVVNDSYGDGICCDYGQGWYELRDASGDVLLESDGYYGYREKQRFCLDGSSRLASRETERDVRLPRPVRQVPNRSIGQ